MKLFIIGNGFDLGHGLPTSYWSFRIYLSNMYPDFLQAFEQHYCIYPKTSEGEKKNLLWNELEANLANIDEDVIIEDALGIDMDLESGDVGIEDTLYLYFSEEYDYIQKLAKYLKQWVRTIRIRDIKKKTSHISSAIDAYYITFNYTAVLENVYQIPPQRITHIHGSLREYDIAPVLGHGNIERITSMREKKKEADRFFDEKEASICRAIEDYYTCTFKDVSRYACRLPSLSDMDISEIEVIGHSLAGVDIRYFCDIDISLGRKTIWNVYYYTVEEKDKLYNNLILAGIANERIRLIPSSEFYDIEGCT